MLVPPFTILSFIKRQTVNKQFFPVFISQNILPMRKYPANAGKHSVGRDDDKGASQANGNPQTFKFILQASLPGHHSGKVRFYQMVSV